MKAAPKLSSAALPQGITFFLIVLSVNTGIAVACTSLCHKALCAIKPDNQNSSQWKCSVEPDAVFFGNNQPSVINWCWNYPQQQEDENLLRWKIKLRLRLNFIGEFSLMFYQTGAWLMWRMKGCVQVKEVLFESITLLLFLSAQTMSFPKDLPKLQPF